MIEWINIDGWITEHVSNVVIDLSKWDIFEPIFLKSFHIIVSSSELIIWFLIANRFSVLFLVYN